MRLLITQAPERRHFCMSGQPRIFGHDRCWIACRDEKNVERPGSVGTRGLELTFRAGQVKSAEGMVEKHSPSVCPDQPGNGHASAVSGKLVTALSAYHLVLRATAIELRTAFPQAEQR